MRILHGGVYVFYAATKPDTVYANRRVLIIDEIVCVESE